MIDGMRVVLEVYCGAYADPRAEAWARVRPDGIVEIVANERRFDETWIRYGVDLSPPGNVVEEENVLARDWGLAGFHRLGPDDVARAVAAATNPS
jgi:hypothetical protein